ncbi:MAG: polysaccharide biosynthesis/export family protein [Myxococcales bacterium]|nr:polysaccharide biosynthesis/export family protein [Myxococcales bacterium]
MRTLPSTRGRGGHRGAGGWFLAVVAVGLSTTSCYRPKGAFRTVDDYLPPVSVGEYVIMPGDVLQVRVFQQEAMSSRVRVRVDGRVSLPLVNDWMAAGKTPAALALELQQALKGFINAPVVTVSVEESRPLSVSILGEVARPGVVVLEPGAGVLTALSAAGGFTDFAHRDGIFVLRSRPGEASPARILFTWDALTSGDGRAATFRLLPGDVVVVE